MFNTRKNIKLGYPRTKILNCLGLRQERGDYLIEVIVAVLVSSIFATAMVQAISQTMTISTAAQNQVICSSIAHEIMDSARNMPFGNPSSTNSQPGTLVGFARNNSNTGSSAGAACTYNLCMSSDTTGCLDSANYMDAATMINLPFPRALLQDRSNYKFSEQSKSNTLPSNSTVQEILTLNTDNSVTIDVKINWSDSKGPHQYETSTTITQFGISVD